VTSREHDIAQAALQRIVCLQIKLLLGKKAKTNKISLIVLLNDGPFLQLRCSPHAREQAESSRSFGL